MPIPEDLWFCPSVNYGQQQSGQQPGLMHRRPFPTTPALAVHRLQTVECAMGQLAHLSCATCGGRSEDDKQKRQADSKTPKGQS